MSIYFREDLSKEDREARRHGRKAFLKEGYAVIDGRKIEP